MTLERWMEANGYLIEDINYQGEHGYTALMRAAKEGEVEIVKAILVRDGVDVNLANVDGNNVLWNGCFSGSAEIVEMLIAAGADLDNINDNGVTALMYTASSGKESMTKMLLDAGADRTIKNVDDFTALDLASTRNIVKMLRA